MAFFDLPRAKLKTYRGTGPEPRDFDAFWARTLKETRKHPLSAKFERVDADLYESVHVFDVTFNGYGGQPVKGWFLEPAGSKSKNACVVTYIGYGGGRNLPVEWTAMPSVGVSIFVMDTRGQGSSWAPGDTDDEAVTGPSYPGVMTRGIESPDRHYYRRVYTDAVRAIEAAKAHPRVDPARVGVTGVSQGGGITLAAAGLAGRDVRIAMPDVPFLCDFRRAATIVDTAPYSEIINYLKTHRGKGERAFDTLAYFDGMHFASRITARCLFSVGLMDTVCPPSTVYAAYNRVKGKKEIRVYEYNNHEGGGPFHAVERLRFAKKHL